ncbi:MAG: hypothetical protein IPN09_07515 [Bacteroidetes bacterium]|nr:hypothetical protein [Bacteroidota bacterium]
MKKFLFFIFCLFSQYCFGSITIDSLKITQSSCQKNGSITIYAKTDRPPMVYSILEGPEVRPAQSGNSFTSLAKGIYKVLITNFSNDSVIKTIDILSNYVQPDFSFNFTNAFCNTSNDGTITGFPNFTNRLPLKWVINKYY